MNYEQRGTHVTQISIHIPVNFSDNFFRSAREKVKSDERLEREVRGGCSDLSVIALLSI